jgi:hypothetical protein
MPGVMGDEPPSLDQMKRMDDQVAAPVLERIKNNPKDFESLNEVGKVYRATHQFKEAAVYCEKALQIDPKSAAVRTDLASCLDYTGDVATVCRNKCCRCFRAIADRSVCPSVALKEVPPACPPCASSVSHLEAVVLRPCYPFQHRGGGGPCVAVVEVAGDADPRSR